MTVTLRDIAKATGYSVNTVSRALRGDCAISREARDVISECADRLGYIPNAIASSMRLSRSGTIGVISADSSNPFFAEVVKGIEEKAAELNMQIMVGSTEESAEKEMHLIRLFLSRKIDGLILMPVFDESERHLEFFSRIDVPFVFAGRTLRGFEAHSILHSDFTGQKQVFDHLISRGHREIFYIAGPENVSNTPARIEGMKASLAENGIAFSDKLVRYSSGHIEDGYAIMNQLLSRRSDVTAVACFNDLIAMGVLKSLGENDLKVPEDVEVFGYDNLYMSQFMQPSLSTVNVPKFQLGYTAMETLCEHIEDRTAPYVRKELPVRLLFRESTRT